MLYLAKMLTPQQRLIRILLSVLFIAALLRIVGYAVLFAADNLQMDFSAYYTAGEALNHGLSPYLNQLNAPSKIWDGINLEKASRFLYPPLAANIFQFFALLPFAAAKTVWTGILLLCLAASLYIALRVLKQPLGAAGLLVLGIFTCLFYPLFLLLERGQVDSITLLLLTSGMAWITLRKRTFWAGILFALAALLKLHSLYILPFLILRRQWKAVGGLAAGGAGIILLSTLLNGSASTLNYIRTEIPAISNYYPASAVETEPYRQTALEMVRGLPAGYTLKDGARYRITWTVFEQNATLLRTRVTPFIIDIYSKLFGRAPNDSVLSLIYFGVFFGGLIIWEARHGFRSQEGDTHTEFIFWQMPLAIILLCAPLTWVMNVVWLLPAAVVFLAEWSFKGNAVMEGATHSQSASHPEVVTHSQSASHPGKRLGAIVLVNMDSLWILSMCAGILGLILAGIPDAQGFRFLVPYGEHLLRHKYVFGELLVLGGLFGLLIFHRGKISQPPFR